MYRNLLILLCLFHLIGNIAWISLNKAPPAWDQAGHTIIAFNFADFFRNFTGNFLSISDYYPPFVHLIVSFFMLIFGKSLLVGPLVVTGFFIFAIIFVYLYTFELFKNRFTALIAALLFSFLPNMYALSREFLLEIPLVSMVLGSLFFLEKSDTFKIRKYTFLFAVFLGLALAIKWTAIIFLFVPILFKFIRMFPIFAWKNLLLTLGVVLAINLAWYLNNLPVILHAAEFTSKPEAADPQKILSFENFKFYFLLITNFHLTWLGMLIFLASIVYFLKRKSYLLPTFLFVYLVFSLVGNKNLRYIIFLAPLATIIIAHFLYSFRNKVIIQVLGIILFSFYAFYYVTLSFGLPFHPEKVDFSYSYQIPLIGWIDLVNLGKDTSKYLVPTYNQTVWPNSLVAKELSKHNPKKKIEILILSEKPYFNQVNMELARKQLNLNNIQFIAPYEQAPFPTDQLLEKYLLEFDVILVANKDIGYAGAVRHFAALQQMSDYLKMKKSENLVKINSYFLPDTDTLEVYKPKVDPI